MTLGRFDRATEALWLAAERRFRWAARMGDQSPTANLREASPFRPLFAGLAAIFLLRVVLGFAVAFLVRPRSTQDAAPYSAAGLLLSAAILLVALILFSLRLSRSQGPWWQLAGFGLAGLAMSFALFVVLAATYAL